MPFEDTICLLQNIDLLITDNQIPSTILESYKQRGLVVI